MVATLNAAPHVMREQARSGGNRIPDENAARSQSRYRRALVTGVTSLGAKFIVLISTIIYVPLTFKYLGADRYGLWMTITSLVLFLGFADFGLGNGLANAISEANGRDDRQYARRQVSCAFFLLLGIAVSLIGMACAVCPMIPWASVYGTHTVLAGGEAGPATALLIVCAALNMPLGTVLRVQMGYQEAYIGDLWNALGNLLALAAVVSAVKLNCGLPVLVFGLAGAPLLTTATNWVLEFGIRKPWLRPKLGLVEWKPMLDLARTGFLFFVQQCFGLIYFVSDNMVIAQTLDSAHVARFAVLQRIFSLGLVSQYFMNPLWPAFSEALVRHDFGWARSTVRKALLGNLVIGGSLGACLFVVSTYLAKRWTGADVSGDVWLRTGFAIWVVLVGYVAAMNSFLNQRGIMGRYLLYFGSASVCSLVLKIVLARYWSLAGIVWATLIGFGFIYIVPTIRLAFGNINLRERSSRYKELLRCA